jgi:hypothetical protein
MLFRVVAFVTRPESDSCSVEELGDTLDRAA